MRTIGAEQVVGLDRNFLVPLDLSLMPPRETDQIASPCLP
jgi:hypothetical protein